MPADLAHERFRERAGASGRADEHGRLHCASNGDWIRQLGCLSKPSLEERCGIDSEDHLMVSQICSTVVDETRVVEHRDPRAVGRGADPLRLELASQQSGDAERGCPGPNEKEPICRQTIALAASGK